MPEARAKELAAAGETVPERIEYATNTSSRAGIGLSYHGIGAAYSKPMADDPARCERYGTTEGDNYQLFAESLMRVAAEAQSGRLRYNREGREGKGWMKRLW